MNFVFPDCIYDRLNCFFPSPISCWIFYPCPCFNFCVGTEKVLRGHAKYNHYGTSQNMGLTMRRFLRYFFAKICIIR